MYTENENMGIFVEKQVRKPDFVMTYEHTHDYIEIFYLKTGQCNYTVEDRKYHLSSGEVFIVPPGMRHCTGYEGKVRCERVIICIKSKLIPNAFRKEHPLLRLTSGDEVAARVTAVTDLDKNVLAFTMDNTDKAVEGETAEQIFLAFNPNDAATTITLPEGNWNVYVKGTKAGTEVIETVSGTLTVDPVSAVVLVKGENKGTASTNAPLLPIAAGVAGLIAIVGGIFVVLKRKKK